MEPLQKHTGAKTGGAEHLLSGLAPRTRVIVDKDGRIWTVEQLRAAAADPIQDPSLLFTTENLMRRIRRFPDDWHSMNDAELYELSLKP